MTRERGRLAGRTAMVTGGASGIGRAIAERFTAEGARVAIADKAGADEAASGIPGAIAISMDVTRRPAVEGGIEDAIARLGYLDLLVISAGISRPAPFLEMTDEAWTSVIDVNLTGSFFTTQAAGRHMVTRGFGRIIIIASTCAQRATTLRANYNSSKGGVISLMQTAACELAEYGVTVNAISPGPVETPLSRRTHTDALRQAIYQVTPIKRYGEVAEIAGAAVYLASDEAAYVTGHELTIDGGSSAALYLFK